MLQDKVQGRIKWYLYELFSSMEPFWAIFIWVDYWVDVKIKEL